MERIVKSANRVFQLLEVFEQKRRPLRVGVLAELLGAPQSSVSMLLKTLVANGYVDFDPSTREYSPSIRVAYLCEWVTRLPHRVGAISEALRILAAVTGETILLARIEGSQLQYVSIIESPENDLHLTPVPGMKRHLHLVTLGIMLLSTLSEEDATLLLHRYNADATERRRVDIQATLALVRRAGDLGYCDSTGLAVSGAGVIATLLPTPIRGQRLAIGIGGPQSRMLTHRRLYLEALLEAAARC